jgi:hypothetical protein
MSATISLANFALPVSAATAPQLGVIVFADHARVGLAPASVGSTVFGGDQLSTDATGSVQIRAGEARFLLANGGVATLSSDEAAPAATLIAGTATFSTANSKAFTLRFVNAAIRANTDEPTVGQISVVGPKELIVKSTRGSLAFTVGGETRLVTEGAAYRVILNPTVTEAATAAAHARADAAQQQPGVQRAGEVSRVIPSVTIERDGKDMGASASTVVAWNDQISTVANARARVGLDDGSVLNVGSDSAMRVLKHDAAAQQTELELTYGKLRSRAQKVVKTNGKFEVRTGAGIAGVVGTDFYVGYDRAQGVMTVLVFEGLVRVCNLAGACVILRPGEMTTVHNDGTPPLPPILTPLDSATAAAADTDDGGEAATTSPSSAAQSGKGNNRQRGGGSPVGAGSSTFVWYAIGVVAVVTAIALHKAYESPDRP